ncbi:MAG: THUMP domain-containing protein [Candidatus Methanofastidiosia archaeon]
MYFIATTPIIRQYDAMWELEWALGEKAHIKRTTFPGVIIVRVDLERDDAIQRVKEYETTAIYKIIPIDTMIKTGKEAIISKGLELARANIDKDDTFAVRCRRRGNIVSSSKDIEKELGATIVDNIGAKVNLSYPQKIVKVEIIGKRTGISVLTPDEIITKNVVE